MVVIYSMVAGYTCEDIPIFLARVAAREKANSCSFEDALKRFTDSSSVKQVPPSLLVCANVRKVRLFPLASQNLFIQSNDPVRETGLLHIREKSNWYVHPEGGYESEQR